MSFWSQNAACSNNEPAYRQKHAILGRGLGALAILSSSVAAVGWAQDAPSGLIARLDVTQRLEFSDNPDLDVDEDSDFFGRTILAFNLESVTSTERFALNLGADIEEFGDGNSSDIDITNSFANLSYNRNTGNAFFGGDLRFSETDTDGGFSDADFAQDSDIIDQDDGSRLSYGYTLRAGVGQQAPIGANIAWTFNQIQFDNTNDVDLNDSTLNSVSGQVDFRINPDLTASLTGQYVDFDTDSPTGTDRETASIGVAADLQLSQVLTASVGLSYDLIERTGGTNSTDDGLSGSIDLTRTMTNGTISIGYASDVFANDDGRRSFLSVTRDLTLQRGSLSLSLGVTGTEVVGDEPLIEANYFYELPNARFNFSFGQSVSVGDEDDEDINTSLRASYDQRINDLSSFSINFDFFNRNELEDGGDDGQRYNIGATYRRDLTGAWGLVGGVSYTLLTEDDDEDRDRMTVFVGLQRSFNWNP